MRLFLLLLLRCKVWRICRIRQVALKSTSADIAVLLTSRRKSLLVIILLAVIVVIACMLIVMHILIVFLILEQLILSVCITRLIFQEVCWASALLSRWLDKSLLTFRVLELVRLLKVGAHEVGIGITTSSRRPFSLNLSRPSLIHVGWRVACWYWNLWACSCSSGSWDVLVDLLLDLFIIILIRLRPRRLSLLPALLWRRRLIMSMRRSHPLLSLSLSLTSICLQLRTRTKWILLQLLQTCLWFRPSFFLELTQLLHQSSLMPLHLLAIFIYWFVFHFHEIISDGFQLIQALIAQSSVLVDARQVRSLIFVCWYWTLIFRRTCRGQFLNFVDESSLLLFCRRNGLHSCSSLRRHRLEVANILNIFHSSFTVRRRLLWYLHVSLVGLLFLVIGFHSGQVLMELLLLHLLPVILLELHHLLEVLFVLVFIEGEFYCAIFILCWAISFVSWLLALHGCCWIYILSSLNLIRWGWSSSIFLWLLLELTADFSSFCFCFSGLSSSLFLLLPSIWMRILPKEVSI